MLGQLDRLISFSALPNVRLGIVGFETAYGRAARAIINHVVDDIASGISDDGE
jgi:hypothetical protein